MSGLIADAKTLIDKARVETQVKSASTLPFHHDAWVLLFSDDTTAWAVL